MATHLDTTPAAAGEGSAAPIANIHPRMPAWRSIKDLDDAIGECMNLSLILDVAEDILRETVRVLPDGSRNADIDKAGALVAAAQGASEYLTVALEALQKGRAA